MRIEQWKPGDEAAVRACHDVWLAARETDDPLGSPKSAHVLGAWLQHGFQGRPGEAWLARDAPGAPVIAWYRLGLPDRENRESGYLHLVVHPDRRRGGVGAELLGHATERAKAHDRTRMVGEVREGGAGEAFAARYQAARGITEVRRVLDVTTIPDGHLEKLRGEAVSKAAGYTLVTWTGPTPEKYQAPIAAVHEAMNDAPHNPGFEPKAWDAERVREDDAHMTAFGFRSYSVAAVLARPTDPDRPPGLARPTDPDRPPGLARPTDPDRPPGHDLTGQAAALTQVFVDPEVPDWAHQGLTAVSGAHRGHRLGLLVKSAMLQWLAEAEPRIRRIDTGNANSNKHMIAINEALGFRVHGPGWVSYDKTFSSERITAPV